MASLVMCALDAAIKDLREADAARVKAGRNAVSVEGFRLMRLLQAEIRAGAPGGRKFQGLTEIAKMIGSSGAKHKNSPLYTAFHAIRYLSNKLSGDFTFSLGAVEGKTSSTWIKIMKRQQEGFDYPVDDSMRSFLKRIGAGLKGARTKNARGAAKYFFLLPSTTQFRIPARDVVDAFWSGHRAEVMPNIQNNYERKLRGERI